MIEHYVLSEINNLTDRFGLDEGVPKGVRPRFNISPVQLSPVIVQNGDKTALEMMTWGLVAKDAKNTSSVFRYKTFNTKSEKVFSKPVWETAVRRQRCIIPANGFYMQRNNVDSKSTYYFTSPEQTLLGLAGIYTTWTNLNGTAQHMYTLLTIDANGTMTLPFRRMPVILHSEDESKWLNSSVEDFSSLVRIMRPYEGSPLNHHVVTNDVNSTKIDASYLIEHIE